MKNKKFYYCIYILMCLVGTITLITGIVSTSHNIFPDGINGFMTGAGSALLGLGIIYILISKFKPQYYKQITIENNDERNIMIKNKSLALAGQILFYSISALVMICVVLNEFSWILWSLVCLDLTYAIAQIFFYYKFQHKC